MSDEPILLLLMLLFGVGPLLATAAFGLIARVSAIGVPSESLAKGSAVSSLLCAIVGLLSLVLLAISIMMGMDTHRQDGLSIIVATSALILSALGSLFTFAGFTAQVGIYQRSPAVSRGLARTGIAVTICLFVLVGIGTLYTLANEVSSPGYGYRADAYGRGNYYYPDHSGFFQVMTGLLMPLSLGVILILYHRLLAAGRRAINNEPPTSDLQD